MKWDPFIGVDPTSVPMGYGVCLLKRESHGHDFAEAKSQFY